MLQSYTVISSCLLHKIRLLETFFPKNKLPEYFYKCILPNREIMCNFPKKQKSEFILTGESILPMLGNFIKTSKPMAFTFYKKCMVNRLLCKADYT